ncbi:hypothetical protein A3Q56_08073, partial [Intoshia linei]
MSDQMLDVKPTNFVIPIPKFSKSNVETWGKLIRLWSESCQAPQSDQIKLIIFNLEISLHKLLLEEKLPVDVNEL